MDALAYLATAMTGLWGVAHVAPTRKVVAGQLAALAALTAVTGARTPVVWFKVCPVLLATSAALLVAASVY